MTVQRWLPAVACVLTIGLYLGFLTRDYPFVGHDFAEFIPRLVDTDLHIRINGLTTQWYTPTFGGGLPAFANPQHYEYSIVQLLLLIMGPWQAVMTTTTLVSIAGFIAFYLFLSEELRLGTAASTLGAIGIVGNGWYIEHLVAGQLAFQLYPLIGVLVLALMSRRFTIVTAAVICGLTMASVVHAGGGLLSVFFAGTLILTLQLVSLIQPRVVPWFRVAAILSVAFVVAAALCASKLYAVRALMTHFPRELSDSYGISTAHAIFGLGTQLAGGMMILPVLVAGGYLPQRIDDALIGSTGAGVHVWELDASVQPILLIALAIAIGAFIWRRVRHGGAPIEARGVEVALLVITTWIAIETTLAKGWIYPQLHQLPFFRSMHVNHRAAVVFIVPLTIAGAVAIDKWKAQRRPTIAAALVAITLLLQSSYFLLPDYVHRRWFDITQTQLDHARVRQGERFPIARVDEIQEPMAFSTHSSARIPYEPLFGYDNENFHSELQNGPVDAVRDGKFNLTNPASFVFPELNGLKGPFERIHADDRANLDRFVNRLQPAWKHPALLDWLNRLGFLTLVACLLLIARAAIMRLH